MTEKKNNSNSVSNTPALDRLFKIPEGFTEKRRTNVEKTSQSAKQAVSNVSSAGVSIPETDTTNKKPVKRYNNTRKKPANKPVNNSAASEQVQVSEKPLAQGQQKPAARQQKPKQNTKKPSTLANERQTQKSEAVGEKQTKNSTTNNTKKKQRNPRTADSRKKPAVRIIPLGGLGEIGKNMTAYECGEDIIIVDCGLAFPDNDMLGVDLVIPDFTYLLRNLQKVRGLFITHGHEDHIGGIAYMLRDINVPVYGTKLTMGLIEGKLKEQGLLESAKLHVVQSRDTVKAGCFNVEFIHVNHSFPDACALALHTPAGVIIQTGDFKIDYTPIQGDVIDLRRFGELGDAGVLALLCDSTNAEKPGYTQSERIVGYSFDKLFAEAENKRIIVATFASNVHRLQQVIDTAVKTNRKVAVFGRSMVNVVQKAIELGYLKVKEGVIIDIDTMHNYTDGQLVVISTGSQGEPMSALTRMSSGDHRQVKINSGDYIIISATPIPGNEKHVGKVINELMKLGAEVIYERMYDVHVSGHACQDEIKTILALTKPKFYMPVHGEYKHLVKNAAIAKSMGYTNKNIIIGDIGKVVETDGVNMRLNGIVPAGRVLVDGLGVGDVGSIVLRDRKLLSEEGLIVAVISIDNATGEILAGPDLVSRGFVYVREAEDMMADARSVVLRTLENCNLSGFRDWGSIKGKIRDDLSEFIYTRTKRKPMILPVIQEV